jgi:hypothetical protein
MKTFLSFFSFMCFHLLVSDVYASKRHMEEEETKLAQLTDTPAVKSTESVDLDFDRDDNLDIINTCLSDLRLQTNISSLKISAIANEDDLPNQSIASFILSPAPNPFKSQNLKKLSLCGFFLLNNDVLKVISQMSLELLSLDTSFRQNKTPIKGFMKSLSNHRTLESLSLHSYWFNESDDDPDPVLLMLLTNKKLQKVKIDGGFTWEGWGSSEEWDGISASALALLCAVFRVNTTLQTLSLPNQVCIDKNVPTILDNLSENTTLKVLNLKDNPLTNKSDPLLENWNKENSHCKILYEIFRDD